MNIVQKLQHFLSMLLFVLIIHVVAKPTLAQNAPEVFLDLRQPVGIEVNIRDNVYVQWDNLRTFVLSVFRPDRTEITSVPVGNFLPGSFQGRMVRLPDTETVLLMSGNGVLFAFDPGLQPVVVADLSVYNFSPANNIYNVATDSAGNFATGVIDWGDIAAFKTPEGQYLVYISATTGTAGDFPFVLRLTIDLAQEQVLAVDPIVWSSGTTAGAIGAPSGIAVNPQGTVLTGFPVPVPFRPGDPLPSPEPGNPNGRAGFIESLVTFDVRFPEIFDLQTAPRFILTNPATRTGIQDLASVGMASDAAGNFYVATGVIGSSACGAGGSSALVVLPPDLDPAGSLCQPLPAVIALSSDVAVSPLRFTTYLTLSNQIVRFPPFVTSATTAAQRFTIVRKNLRMARGNRVADKLTNLEMISSFKNE